MRGMISERCLCCRRAGFHGGKGAVDAHHRQGRVNHGPLAPPRSAGGDKDRIASFTIGINPKAKLGFNLNPIAAGAVSIAIGGNQDLKGRNKSSFYFQETIERADLIADGQMLVKAGKINQ